MATESVGDHRDSRNVSIAFPSSHTTTNSLIPDLQSTGEGSFLNQPEERKCRHDDGSSEGEQESFRSHLRRFAYVPGGIATARPDAKKAGLRHNLQSSSVLAVPRHKAPSRPERRAQTGPHVDVSKRRLADLKKCVCCDREWTVFKSSADKTSHLRDCAKKRKITNLSDRILKELDEDSRPAAPHGRLGRTGLISDLSSYTRLEDLVHGAARQKRKRRSVATATIQPIALNERDILDRAHALLRGGATSVTSSTTGSRDAPEAVEPSNYAVSILELMVSIASIDDASIKLPPATQPFGESRLRARQALPGTPGDATPSPDHEPQPTGRFYFPPPTSFFFAERL
ncbi:unnamed protein product [Peniophora sp. CBMAI 1063]|nr:unnamed protein product [Peniophora sp. CBMAI 1063]